MASKNMAESHSYQSWKMLFFLRSAAVSSFLTLALIWGAPSGFSDTQDSTQPLAKKVEIIRPSTARPITSSARIPPTRSRAQNEPQEETTADNPSQEPMANLYAEEYFMPSSLRLQHEVTEVDGFLFIKTPSRVWKTNYSIITAFKGEAIKTRYVPGLISVRDIRDWVNESLYSSEFEGVPVHRLKIPSLKEGSEGHDLYWVGHQSYDTADEARSQVALTRSIVETQGGDFDQMIAEARRYIPAPEPEDAVEIKTPAQFAREEAIALKWIRQLQLGDKLFGPFQGVSPGEPIVWQSFGETTFRNTNLVNDSFNNQVGFWTNRVVFEGIKAPLNTIDPYLEATVSLEGTHTDFASNMKVFAGLEWRPWERSTWLNNFRPWGLPLLSFVKSYRVFVQYGERINIKDEITGSDNHDLHFGVNIFYEFGLDPPELNSGPPITWQDYVRRYVWGEYFGDYKLEMTNFSSKDDFDAFTINNAVILGIKLPGIPLPENPINHELVLMPYMKLDHITNTKFSDVFQNRYSIAAGVRWMPFSNYRYKGNEWLSKVKIFGEFVGIGKTQHTKPDHDPLNQVRKDFRVGVNISSQRF